MAKQESYVERRQLFKNIWDAAMFVNGKEEIMNKPKVIRTLRLDDVDRCAVGKSKKERIKNLRHVCNKILDFCDKQEANIVYTKITNQPRYKADSKGKKLKPKRKKSGPSATFGQQDVTVARTTAGKGNENAIIIHDIRSRTKANVNTIPSLQSIAMTSKAKRKDKPTVKVKRKVRKSFPTIIRGITNTVGELSVFPRRKSRKHLTKINKLPSKSPGTTRKLR